MQNNSLDVIFGNRDAQIVLYLFFIVVENLAPIGVGARQCPRSASGAIGPTYDTIRDVVPRVYAAKSSSVNIHFDIEVAASASREPIARGIRIGIIRRALQEKELCVFLLGGRLRYRDVMRCCKHFALGGNGGRRNSNFSFSNTSHFAARVNSGDGRIARRPCNIGCIRSELRSFKLIDRAGARDSEVRNRFRRYFYRKGFGFTVPSPVIPVIHGIFVGYGHRSGLLTSHRCVAGIVVARNRSD